VDGNLQRKIVEALDPSPEDEVLEIGPGKGALTRHLVGRCGTLFLVELDRDLARALTEEFEDRAEVRVTQGDILGIHPSALTPRVERLKVVGNIPYNITSPLIFHLLTPPRPARILLMVQKEVGQRIVATSGTSAFGALTVGVQAVAGVERVMRVPASAFRPVPAVDSVVLRLSPTHPAPLSPQEEGDLRFLTRRLFQQRRKQLQSIFRGHPELGLTRDQTRGLEELTGIDLRLRPENLAPFQFVELSRAFRSLMNTQLDEAP